MKKLQLFIFNKVKAVTLYIISKLCLLNSNFASLMKLYIVFSFILSIGFLVYPILCSLINDIHLLDTIKDYQFNYLQQPMVANFTSDLNTTSFQTSDFEEVHGEIAEAESNNKNDSKALYKNPYVIVGIISLICFGVLVWYIGNIQDDSSDTASACSSTLIGTDWSATSTVYYNGINHTTPFVPLINFVLDNTYDPLFFRHALYNLGHYDITEYLPKLGTYFTLDIEMLNFLRTQIESNTLNLTVLTDEIGESYLRIFNSGLNSILFDRL